MHNKIIIGFDPGVNGGMAILWDFGNMEAHAFESFTDYCERLQDIKTFADNEGFRLKAYVEELTGTTSGSFITPPASFKLGRNVGAIEGLLIALKIPFESVRPQIWQKGLEGVKALKGGDKKRKLKDHACQRYPDAKPTLKTADAILIADWGSKR